MTKADLVSNISDKLGIDKADVQATIEKFMKEIKVSLEKGENVYLRGFGSFIVKKRAEKTARNIKIINTGKTGLPSINNVIKINDKSTVERSLNLKFLTFIKFLIFRFKLIFIPHIFFFF